jgi:hypothetical protein
MANILKLFVFPNSLIFINNMENNLSPTKKEQVIIKYLVKNFSLEDLQKDLDKNSGNGYSNCADSIIKSLAIKDLRTQIKDMLGLQCLYYAITNYENVKNNNFEAPIERANLYNITRYFEEQVTQYVTYSTTFYSIPSLLENTLESVKDNYWNFDTDKDTIDWGDNDVIEEDYKKPEVDVIGPMKGGTIN